MAYNAWFRSISNENDKYPLNDIIYRSPKDNELLEVEHDLNALRDRSSQSWIKLFDERYRSSQFPYGSGVWGKKEWILPNIKDEHIVSMYEGSTNLYRSERLEELFGLNEIWVKLCGNSHTGSFKDLGMTVLVSQVKAMRAEGKPIKAIACASTGDTSAALAAYAANANIQSIILLPKDKVTIAQLIQPVANGAMVLALDTDFDGCMSIVQKLTLDKEIYLANSMNSLRIEGQKTVGIEVIQQLGWRVPDWFIIPGGNLGNVSALGKGLMMMYKLGLIQKLPRICVAQASKANPLYRAFQSGFKDFNAIAAEKTLASAIQIGNPISYKKAVKTLKEFNGVVEEASEEELANAAARADLSGLLTDPHTGVALAALQKMKDKGLVQKRDSVVVISTAHGLKFIQFKVKYHEDQLEEINARYKNEPIEAKADVDTVKRLVDQRINENIKKGLMNSDENK